ncbi:MAG TPA: STAS domain-containing protein [Terriglobia bacterium]|nr:STAS domain-containing protein [Terriglobia bacterium]
MKITTEQGAEAMTLKLEGKIAGPWVAELERAWQASAASCDKAHITVDLSAVTFIDAEGKKLLAEIHQQKGRLQAAGCMTRCVVEEIKRRLPWKRS